MKTQIQIDCEVTLTGMGSKVISSKLDAEKKEITFVTEKIPSTAAQSRVQSRIDKQQREEYKAIFIIQKDLNNNENIEGEIKDESISTGNEQSNTTVNEGSGE